jgi:CobQ-like glutamine amidotransferase family enzyme
MSSRQIHIVHLYPKEMNIYGDTGNVIVTAFRAKQHGVDVKVSKVGLGDKLPVDVDVIISGGGQDSGQLKVADDLQVKKAQLLAMAKDGVSMLVICGTYQLFGHRFKTFKMDSIPGIGLFDMETIAGEERMIGNIVTKTHFGEVVGYENHSGQTVLAKGQSPFAKVIKGAGNNGQDGTEGAIANNVIGTYLHGPLLPKNPKIADELIRRALVRKYGDAMLTQIDDSIALKAAAVAKNRPR